jgi:uncharacterized membrane protein YdbT with pleckstrin-like domain
MVVMCVDEQQRMRTGAKKDDDEGEDEEYEEEDDDESTVRRTRRSRNGQAQEQVIAGVPNELLLPGAIVTLAVVIVGVFTIARATSR